MICIINEWQGIPRQLTLEPNQIKQNMRYSSAMINRCSWLSKKNMVTINVCARHSAPRVLMYYVYMSACSVSVTIFKSSEGEVTSRHIQNHVRYAIMACWISYHDNNWLTVTARSKSLACLKLTSRLLKETFLPKLSPQLQWFPN